MKTTYTTTDQNTGNIIANTNSLHEACKSLAGSSDRNVFRNGALVAFWSETVRAGFGATPAERAQIELDRNLY